MYKSYGLTSEVEMGGGSSRRALIAALAGSVCVSALLSTSAYAQSSGDAVVLDEIVVTARYRKESLQEVPLTVTAYNEGQIIDARID